MPPYSMHVLNAFLITVLLIQILQPMSRRLGLIDTPNWRKFHQGNVPVVGGIAMFVGLIVPVLAGGGALQCGWNLVAGLAILVGLGVLDDALDLPGVTKLVAQVVAALVMTLPDGRVIADLGHLPLLGIVPLGPAALPFTVLFIVAVINAFNMFDGLDGLAGGTAAIALAAVAIAANARGHDAHLGVALLVLFAVVGFLIFNMRHPWRLRACVYMGDAGSMMLGAVIAYLTIGVVAEPARPGALASPPLAAVGWALALPVIDMLSLIPRRLRAGCSPMMADRRHIHHLLVDSGVSARKTVALLLAVEAALSGIGVLSWMAGVPEHLLAAALLLPIVAHAVFVRFGVRWLRRAAASHPVTPQPNATDLIAVVDVAYGEEQGHASANIGAPR